MTAIDSKPPVTDWPVNAYGLNLRGPESLFPALPATADETHVVELRRADGAELDAVAARGRVTTPPAHERARGFHVIELEDGSLVLSAPDIGLAHLSADGRSVAYAERGDDPRWRLLVMAQALPAAAALRGLESLHAAAVALPGGRCVAIAAPSGVGKTSITTELLLEGDAVLVADDVVAVQPSENGVLAHPGPAWLSVRSDYEAQLRDDADRLGPITPFASKSYHAVERQSGPAMLTGIYALERIRTGAPGITRIESPSLRTLMGLAFVRYIADTRRRRGLFEACAALAATTPLYSVRITPAWDARTTANAVRAHAEAA